MALVKKRNKNEVRSALYGWIAWTPLLAIFVFMAVDTSLSLKVRSAEREFGTLDAQRRQTTRDLNEARSREAQWSDIRRVTEIIAQLNMLPPDPRQIQVVVAQPDTPMPVMKEGLRDSALEVAQAPAAGTGNAANPSVSTAPAVALPVLASTPPPPRGVTVASRPAAPSATAAPATVLDIPKEQITDLDSPDMSTSDLLANL